MNNRGDKTGEWAHVTLLLVLPVGWLLFLTDRRISSRKERKKDKPSKKGKKKDDQTADKRQKKMMFNHLYMKEGMDEDKRLVESGRDWETGE